MQKANYQSQYEFQYSFSSGYSRCHMSYLLSSKTIVVIFYKAWPISEDYVYWIQEFVFEIFLYND